MVCVPPKWRFRLGLDDFATAEKGLISSRFQLWQTSPFKEQGMIVLQKLFRVNPHRAGRTGDYLLSLLYVIRIQVFHLFLGYLLQLLTG